MCGGFSPWPQGVRGAFSPSGDWSRDHAALGSAVGEAVGKLARYLRRELVVGGLFTGGSSLVSE